MDRKNLVWIIALLFLAVDVNAAEFNFFNLTERCEGDYKVKVVATSDYFIQGCVEQTKDIWYCGCEIKKAVLNAGYDDHFYFTIQYYTERQRQEENRRVQQIYLYTKEQKTPFFLDFNRIIIPVLVLLILFFIIIGAVIYSSKKLYYKKDDDIIKEIVYEAEAKTKETEEDEKESSFKEDFDKLLKSREKYIPDKQNDKKQNERFI